MFILLHPILRHSISLIRLKPGSHLCPFMVLFVPFLWFMVFLQMSAPITIQLIYKFLIKFEYFARPQIINFGIFSVTQKHIHLIYGATEGKNFHVTIYLFIRIRIHTLLTE